MIIILHGENSFLSRRKLNEIIEQYKVKHKSGLNFSIFDDEVDFFDLKSAFETVSMFDEKKLIVLEGVLQNSKSKDEIFSYLQQKEAEVKDDKDRVILFIENSKLDAGKDEKIKWIFDIATLEQESKNLSGAKLADWIKKETAIIGGNIEEKAVQFLILRCGDDLWRLSNEISKLVSYKKSITSENIKIFIDENIEPKIFDAISALTSGNKKAATEHFYKVLKSGEDWTRVFTMIVYQFRSMLKVKSLQDDNMPPQQMAKVLKMHPFAVKKILPYTSRYNMDRLKQIYKSLLEAEFSLKTGRASFQTVLEKLILEI